MSRSFSASILRTTVIASALVAAGCSCGADETPDEGASASLPAATTATVEGVIRLAEGADLPAYADNPMVSPQGRPALPDACTPPQQRDAQPVQLSDGGLVGVLVAMHDFGELPPSEPVTRDLTITDCRLTPQLVVAQRGDTLRLRNETDYPFMPDFGGGMMQALLHENDRELELAQGGVRSLGCGFTAPCGRAEIVTLYHPLHTVSGEAGRFRIENVPPGEGIRVSAWHPLFREVSERLDLEAGETATVELVLRPAPAPAAPEPAPERDPNVRSEDDPANVLF